MDKSSEGSSVDPDDDQLFGDGSSSNKKQPSATSDLGNSLSNLDLEHDAEPCTPDSLGPYIPGLDILQELPANQGQASNQAQTSNQGQSSSQGITPAQGLPPCQGQPGFHGSTSAQDALPSATEFDAVIIYHEDDRDVAEDLKGKLKNIKLDDGTAAHVATEDDDVSVGKGEIEVFDDWLNRAEYMFLLLSESFLPRLENKSEHCNL